MSHASPTTPGPRHSRSRGVEPSVVPTVLKVLVFPVFFIVVFTLCYVSAFHDPQPRDAPLGIAGPAAAVAPVAQGLADAGDGALDIRTFADAEEARRLVDERELIGALVLDGDSVTTVLASGDGSALAATVRSAGAQLADQTGSPVTIEDRAPTAEGDSTGSALFYFVIVCTIGGYLTMTVLGQALPTLRRAPALLTLAGMSVFTPVVAGLLASLFVGALGASIGVVVTALVLSGLYTFTIGAITFACNRLFGVAAIMAVLTLVVFINFPSAGGGIPAHLLPGFWQALHGFWVGASITEALRNLVYFPDAALGRHLLTLALWLVAATAASLMAPNRSAREAETPAATPTAV